jgi:hypothetical protein
MVSIESKRQKQRLKKRRADPEFASYLKQIRQRLSSGSLLEDIKYDLGLNVQKHQNLWSDLVYAMAESYIRPENIYLEWMSRQQTTLQMAIKAYSLADKANDYPEMTKSALVISKINEQDFNTKQALGLLKPIKLDDGGEGIPNEDLQAADDRFNNLVNERVQRKLALLEQAKPPVTIDVLIGSESKQQTDSVGQLALVNNNSGRHEPINQNTESISNGSINVCNSVGTLVVQDKTNT